MVNLVEAAHLRVPGANRLHELPTSFDTLPPARVRLVSLIRASRRRDLPGQLPLQQGTGVELVRAKFEYAALRVGWGGW